MRKSALGKINANDRYIEAPFPTPKHPPVDPVVLDVIHGLGRPHKVMWYERHGIPLEAMGVLIIGGIIELMIILALVIFGH